MSKERIARGEKEKLSFFFFELELRGKKKQASLAVRMCKQFPEGREGLLGYVSALSH